MGEPTFWDDPDQAQKITQELNGVKAGVDKYKNILHKFEEMQILWEMGMEDKDETVCDDVEAEIKEINEAIEQLELELLLSGKYDANNAILTLHAGAGGVPRRARGRGGGFAALLLDGQRRSPARQGRVRQEHRRAAAAQCARLRA